MSYRLVYTKLIKLVSLFFSILFVSPVSFNADSAAEPKRGGVVFFTNSTLSVDGRRRELGLAYAGLVHHGAVFLQGLPIVVDVDSTNARHHHPYMSCPAMEPLNSLAKNSRMVASSDF